MIEFEILLVNYAILPSYNFLSRILYTKHVVSCCFITNLYVV